MAIVRRTMTGREVSPHTERGVWAAAVAISLATLWVYAPVVDYPFLTWDDVEYVAANPNLRAPFGVESIARAFTEKYESNWIPLTWISLHLDAALFGLDPAVYHAENVILHLAAALILLFALSRATGSPGASAFVAGVFALHPLHVESVAWVAQRKDCLSGLFFALAVSLHLGGGRSPQATRRAAVALAGGFSMLAKPVAVVLPLVLLLLDFWPLARVNWGARGVQRRLILEKWPLLLMAFLTSGMTVLAQQTAGSLELLQLPLSWRVMNALWNYLAYLGMALWPSGLSFYYTWPLDAWLPWKAGVSMVVMVALALGVLRAARAERAVWVGACWYVLTLLPVVGFVQVGMQGRADRYMFWPLVGLAIAVGFGVRRAVASYPRARRVTPVVAVAALVALAGASASQVHHWRSGVALYQRALDVTEENFFGHWALGGELVLVGRADEADAHYREAIRIRPRWFHPRRDLGLLLLQRGELANASREFEGAVAVAPREAALRLLHAQTLWQLGEGDDAIRVLDDGLALVPPGDRAQLQRARDRLLVVEAR